MIPDLAEHIREGISTRGYRNVFDSQLDEVWPLGGSIDRTKQMKNISKFAADHGWRVKFYRGGLWAVFKPPEAAILD